MDTFSNVKRLFRSGDDFFVVHGTDSPYTTSDAYDLTTGVRMIAYRVSGTLKLDIEDSASAITSPLVKGTIRLDDSESTGKINGGVLNFTSGTTDNIILKGETETHDFDLLMGIKDELHLSIIGVDDIRARGGAAPNYAQLFALEKQEIYLKISGGTNKDLTIHYIKKPNYPPAP